MEVCKKVRYQKPGDEETMNLIRRTLFLGLQAVAVVAVLGLASYLAEPGLIVASPEERAERIGSLIRQMGSDSLQERERASDELVRIGVPALEALRRAEKDSDLELAGRAKECIWKIERDLEIVALIGARKDPRTEKRGNHFPPGAVPAKRGQGRSSNYRIT